ncbi:MAG TPA: DUF4258 domain-containing protein [Tepidisphaeraceae bacterium]|nr:DUF4258 domain-containing protein [Tepidisphaeraceae bacterium]
MVPSQKDWPEWWSWELECSNPHLAKRMIDRGFNEVELRDMLQRANGYRPDPVSGRWVITTTHAGNPWEVVVEPQPAAKLLVVVTASEEG